MRVIFLDIDGVVNTFQIYKEKPAHLADVFMPKIKDYYLYICSSGDGRVSNGQAIIWLEKICKDWNAKIVLTSTWRLRFDNACQALYNTGLSKDVEIIGRTPSVESHYRGKEIQLWLEEHPEVTDFVILDDDGDMEPYMDKLVLIDTYTGINCRTEIEVEKIFDRENLKK